MNWNEYQKLAKSLNSEIKVDVSCPKCGQYTVFKRVDVVLTSYPPQYYYSCKNCGWFATGY